MFSSIALGLLFKSFPAWITPLLAYISSLNLWVLVFATTLFNPITILFISIYISKWPQIWINCSPNASIAEIDPKTVCDAAVPKIVPIGPTHNDFNQSKKHDEKLATYDCTRYWLLSIHFTLLICIQYYVNLHLSLTETALLMSNLIIMLTVCIIIRHVSRDKTLSCDESPTAKPLLRSDIMHHDNITSGDNELNIQDESCMQSNKKSYSDSTVESRSRTRNGVDCRDVFEYGFCNKDESAVTSLLIAFLHFMHIVILAQYAYLNLTYSCGSKPTIFGIKILMPYDCSLVFDDAALRVPLYCGLLSTQLMLCNIVYLCARAVNRKWPRARNSVHNEQAGPTGEIGADTVIS